MCIQYCDDINSFAAFSQQYPRASDEHVPLSSHQGAPTAFSGRLLVDTNLDTSSPDTYTPPPAPIPFNVTLDATQTAPVTQEICDKNNTNSNSVQEPSGDNHGTSPKSEELKESECKGQADLELDSAKDSEIELSKLGEPIDLVEEEDGCPICLEGDVATLYLFSEINYLSHLSCEVLSCFWLKWRVIHKCVFLCLSRI